MTDDQKLNIVRRFYKIGDPVRFFLSEKENSEPQSFFNFQIQGSDGECVIMAESEMSRESLVFGENQLRSCWIRPNRDQFVKFCKDQQDYAVFSNFFIVLI